MPFIDLASVQFYQPPTKAGRPSGRGPTVLATDVPTVAGEGKSPTSHEATNGRSGRHQAHNYLIEVLDLAAPPPRESFSPFHELVPDLKNKEADTEDILNEACTIYNQDYGGSEETEDLPSLEELLLGAQDMQEWQRAGSSGEHLRRSEAKSDHGVINNCNEVVSPRLRQDEGKEKPAALADDCSEDGGSSSIFTTDGLCSEEQNEELDSSDTQLTSVRSSRDDGFSMLHKNNEYSISNIPPDPNILLMSTLGKQTCESNDRSRKDRKPDPLAGEEKEDQWDDKEAEADDEEEGVEEEEPSGDGDKSDASPLRLTKKRSQPTARGKPLMNRRIKRRCFSSPLSSDEETESEDESDISSYSASRRLTNSRTRPTPSRKAHLHKAEYPIRRIIGRRHTASGKLLYRVVWDDSWVPESGLEHAQEAIKEFELKLKEFELKLKEYNLKGSSH
ncbi:MAG: hypothetical protein M1835_008161 [Candelina submexicana]|nr:MAG: hypothetical protein M1835_008161 [Candelina submexicana]